MKHYRISTAMLVVSLFLAPALLAQSPDSVNQSAASPAPSASATEVPRLIKFSGTLLDAQDRPMAGPVGVTFALHAQQTGGAALWIETQNVTPDAHGNYTVLLGANSANGVPAELFASGEARWLEVQVERQVEQPRILLVSVPYALKAKDAETLGGRPASDFVTTETLVNGSSSAGAAAAVPTSSSTTASPTSSEQATSKKAASGSPPPSTGTTPVTTAGGTVNNLAKFDAISDITSSGISENSTGQVGIGVAPSPSVKFFLADSQTNPGTKRLQWNVYTTTVNTNGNNLALVFDLDASNMIIPAGITDTGYRLAVRGLSYANTTKFAGTLNQQLGIVGYAGIGQATSGAKVTSAYGGQFNILNRVAGTTITNAYGVYIANSDTVGTITNRYDLYASSPTANNFFAGNVGIGTPTPADKLDVVATAAGATGLSVQATDLTTANTAVSGLANGLNGSGVFGEAENGSLAFGVWGESASGVAGQFDGNVNVTGTLSKAGGSFKIDHPMDPSNKYLYHSFVESPDMKNIYDGVANLDTNGEAVVQLPDWFGALNKEFRYQLTCIGGFAPVYIAEEISENRFKIAGGNPGMKVSWMVTGIRQDAWANAHRIPVEEEKPVQERGYYLHPELYGQPSQRSTAWAQHPEVMKKKGQAPGKSIGPKQ